jgi:hypothetical protein
MRVVMHWNQTKFVAVVLAALGLGALTFEGPQWVSNAQAACPPDARLDGTTADWAIKHILAGGYQGPRNLRKGCDNYWHADALKDGNIVHVVVTPQGELLTEDD